MSSVVPIEFCHDWLVHTQHLINNQSSFHEKTITITLVNCVIGRYNEDTYNKFCMMIIHFASDMLHTYTNCYWCILL